MHFCVWKVDKDRIFPFLPLVFLASEQELDVLIHLVFGGLGVPDAFAVGVVWEAADEELKREVEVGKEVGYFVAGLEKVDAPFLHCFHLGGGLVGDFYCVLFGGEAEQNGEVEYFGSGYLDNISTSNSSLEIACNYIDSIRIRSSQLKTSKNSFKTRIFSNF